MAGKDLTDLEADLRALRARVEAQAAGIDELRGAEPNRDPPVSRRHLLAGLAGLGAAGVASVATAEPAGAANGDPLLLGQANTAAGTTSLTSTDPTAGLRLSGGGFSALYVENTSPRTVVSNTGYALFAGSDDTAVFVESQVGSAILASSHSATLPAIVGSGREGAPGLGGSSVGGGPQLWLFPFDEDPAGPPATGDGSVGQVRVDGNGDLWICVETGTPAIWTRLLREDTAAGRVVPITPLRVLDTRRTGGRPSGGPIVPGQTQGPLASLQTVTLDLAGVAPIPATASGVIGNATVVSPTGGGWLRVYPAGATVVTSTVNFSTGATIANSFTCGLTPTGLAARASVGEAGNYHLLIDITAYIT